MKGPEANDRRFPLPRRTGHGDFPHPALARVVSSRKHSQRHHAHVLQMSIKANTLPHPPLPRVVYPRSHAPPPKPNVLQRSKKANPSPRPPATLTTALQVLAQPI